MLSLSATYCVFMHFLTFFFNLPRSQKVIYSFHSSYLGQALPVAHSVYSDDFLFARGNSAASKKNPEALSPHDK